MFVCNRDVKVIDANGNPVALTAPENCMAFVFVANREVCMYVCMYVLYSDLLHLLTLKVCMYIVSMYLYSHRFFSFKYCKYVYVFMYVCMYVCMYSVLSTSL